MLPVYASQQVVDFLTATEPWQQLHSNKNVTFQVLDAEQSIGSFNILPVPVPHRGELSDTVAFHIWQTNRQRGTFYCPDIDRSADHSAHLLCSIVLDCHWHRLDWTAIGVAWGDSNAIGIQGYLMDFLVSVHSILPWTPFHVNSYLYLY